MKKIHEALTNAEYIANVQDTVFTVFVTQAFAQNKDKFKSLQDYEYIHGLLQYPQWQPNSDIFQFIKAKPLRKLQKGKAFFVFDASTEGFSPIHDFPFYEILYFNCKKYNVDPFNVIYISANLRDEETIKAYAEKHNVRPLHVCPFPSFERVLTVDDKKGLSNPGEYFRSTIDNAFDKFKDKYFSSLSRVNRKYRTLGTFLLSNSSIANKALISHDKVEVHNFNHWRNHIEIPKEFSDDVVKEWINSLPLIVDRDDFNVNWAIDTPYKHLYDQTIFQIVNETLVLDQNKTTLFFSEKSFRPIAHFQPFLIWGQPGCNRYLEKLGYKTYKDWFDLSFDSIEDPVLRYKKLLETITDTCKLLDSLSNTEKVQWRFKHQGVLRHNFDVMIKSDYSKNKILNFLIGIDNEINSKTR